MSSDPYMNEDDYNHDPVGAASTNEHDDDSSVEEEDHSDDDEADEDNEGMLSYLFDKDSLKQHSFAILVAIIATIISYYHLLPNDTSSYAMQEPIPLETKRTRSKPLKPTISHHHHKYKRTDHVMFCPPTGSEIGKGGSEIISKSLQDTNIDANLHLFQFNFPKEYTDLMNDYFLADESMDDEYTQMVKSDEYADMTEHEQFTCLIDSTIELSHKSTVPMSGIAYKQPHVSTFYKHDSMPKVTSVKLALQNDGEKEGMRPVSLTYTGFTAKFINLSTNPMNLFWDGKNKPKFRARIEPFESFTTVTLPGNSFYMAPTYDKEHAMERWTLTADDAVVAYDAIGNDDELFLSLSKEYRKLYEMQKLNLKFAQEYLVTTKRLWLSAFPRPMPMHFMWDAEYFGQEHHVISNQSHFIRMPPVQEAMKHLDYADYDAMAEKRQKDETFVNLKEYRQDGPLELTLKVASVAPRVFECENFLSDVEVQHLIDMANVYNMTEEQKDGKRRLPKTSGYTNAWLRREMSPIMDAIYHRSADMMKIDESLLRHRNEHEHSELNTHHSIAEATFLTKYSVNQGYIPRSDSTQTSIRNRYQPSRFATVMLFLNDVSEDDGGDTVFPLAVNANNHDGVRITPKKGKAVLFYNMLPDGNIDDRSQHSSEYMLSGEKWLGSFFVWDPIID